MPRGYIENCNCGHPKKCHLIRSGCGANSAYHSHNYQNVKDCNCKEFMPEGWTVYNFGKI